MFDDIIPKNMDGFYKDDIQQKQICHDESCNCDDCVLEAIRQLANKMKLNLSDEAIEEIKTEYLKRLTYPNDPKNNNKS